MAAVKISGGVYLSGAGDVSDPTKIGSYIGSGSKAGAAIVAGTFTGTVSIKATNSYMEANTLEPVLIDNGEFTEPGCRSIDISPGLSVVVEAETGFSGDAYVFFI